MPNQSDIARYRENWQTEREAVALYSRLSETEPHPDLAKLYARLAETELGHANTWERKLAEAGASVPRFKPRWRTRTLSWLAGHFGVSMVLPTIAGIEQNAGSEYDSQPEATELNMQVEERSHARIFNTLARNTGGLEGSAVARFEGRHRATGGNALRAGVLGANDGLVSVFSLVMGVAGAAGANSQAILITGAAGLMAGALSMALGEWLSVQSSRELYQHQLDIEQRELATIPEEEMAELALIYQSKGIPPGVALEMAQRLLSDENTALDTLAQEELGIDPKELGGSAWEAAITSFLLFAAGALIPVLPYVFLTGTPGIIASSLCSLAGLFGIGAAITLMTDRSVWFSGARQVLFGMLAAAITYGIGALIGASLA